MKKLIFLEFALLFLATTFHSDNPPGWYQQQLPVNDFVRDIFFLDTSKGWVATISYIIKTTNGGENWDITDSSNNSYYKIQFFNENTGYRCGVIGGGGAAVWKTMNGGYNWSLKYNFGVGFGIEDMQFINEDTGWVTSSDFDFGGIWKTTDGGNNWIKQISPPPTPVLAIKAISILNKDTGWAINNSGTVKELYRSTNGGVNWNVQYIFSSNLGDLYFFNGLKGIISSGRFYNTTDGGFTWIASQSSETGGKISFANDSTGWAGYNLIYITKSNNGGITWFYQLTNTNNPTPFAISPLNAWAGGNKLIHTTNGGGSEIVILNPFTLQSPPANTTIYVSKEDTSIVRFRWGSTNPNPEVTYKFKLRKTGTIIDYSFLSDNNGTDSGISFRNSFLDSLAVSLGTIGDSVICVWKATAYYLPDSLTSNQYSVTFRKNKVGIIQISSTIPDDNRLYNNYPNPFNPYTVIRYKLKLNSYVKLKVFDINGKVIAVLVNQKQNAGEYKVEFKNEGLSSGVYFYRMEAESSGKIYIESKSMVLIR